MRESSARSVLCERDDLRVHGSGLTLVRVRIIVAGVPWSGKTTVFAPKLGVFPISHTDDLIGKRAWSEASLEVSSWFETPGPWVIEGVATVRALRKWLKRRASGRPCDLLYFLAESLKPTDGRRLAMGVEDAKRFEILRPQLLARGVRVVTLGRAEVLSWNRETGACGFPAAV